MKKDLLGRLQTRSLVGMVSGLIIWAVHFIVVYGGMSLGCAFGWAAERVANLYLINVLLVAATVPLLALIAGLGWASWRRWRLLSAERGEGTTPDNESFLAFVAMLINAISFLAVVGVTAPLFLSAPCA